MTSVTSVKIRAPMWTPLCNTPMVTVLVTTTVGVVFVSASPHHEVFPLPLVKHAQCGVIFAEPIPRAAHSALIDALRQQFPKAEWWFGAARRDVGQGPGQVESSLVQCASDGDAVSVFPTAVFIETAKYEQFSRFRELINRIVKPLDAAVASAVTSVNLRYVDEVRLEGSSSEPLRPADWQPYVTFQMVQGIPGFEGDLAGSYGGLLLHRGTNRHLSLEWSITDQDAVSPDHPLRQWYGSLDRPALVMDWTGHAVPENPIPFDTQAVMKMVDEIYEDIGQAFRATITDECRELMRGNR